MDNPRTRGFRLLIIIVLVAIPMAVTAWGIERDRRPDEQGQRSRRPNEWATRTYTRAEAEVVAARLYRAVLGREGDPGGLRSAAAQIERGNLDSQVDSMLQSREFRRRRTEPEARQLLDQFYQGLLGRKPDGTGARAYIPLLRDGQHADVLVALINSAEFRQVLERTRRGSRRDR
ncbi:MAG TPA: DUF4214 domain-containing protein [Candidatus Limnocylindrales bacterium]